ncbi:dicarboxylate--CoA ligase PimA [Microbaculum marinum]|uniref:Long-chain-fatty-acid--CoA ligase n=1 Tax=Microbaculum marinum TaxID=1764581 RepID=A0AAW9RFA0_9HYPH
MTGRPFAWEKSYPPGISWDAPVQTSSIPELFDRAVADYGPRRATEYRGVPLTYGDYGRLVDEAAASLLRDGIGRDTTLAVYLPNTPWHPVAFFGGLKTGARLVMLSPLDAERELAWKLRDSGARTLITTDLGELLPMACRLLADGHLDKVIVGGDTAWGAPPVPLAPIPDDPAIVRWSDYVLGAEPPSAWPRIDPDDIALLQYTGGTTGRPKGAILTHANLTAATSIYETWFEAQKLSKPGEDRVVCVLPLFHIYALTTILLRQFRAGNEILLRPRFDVDTSIRDIEERRATVFLGVPTMWIAIANAPGIEDRDLSSLRYCGSGGAPLPVESARRFRRLTGLKLLGGWGMTETSPAGTNLPADGPDKPGSIGVPMPGIEVDVVALDDSTRVLPAGETGELRIRGPNVTRGYWNRPEETAAAFVDGRFLTGDIGYMDDDGFFFIVDRKKDMILSGGFNVYPQVIEQAIYEHPAVAEVLVIGVADDYRGESAKAFVTLRPGSASFTLAELQDFLADRIGRHEMPRELEFRDALPRTAVGKLSKIALRDEERQKRRVATHTAG